MKVNANSPQNSAAVDNTDDTKSTKKTAENSKITTKTDAKSQVGSSAGSLPGSTVEISDTARMLQRATDIVNQTPDRRADRIAALKKSIADGTYKIDPGAIADRVLEDHLAAHFGKNNF